MLPKVYPYSLPKISGGILSPRRLLSILTAKALAKTNPLEPFDQRWLPRLCRPYRRSTWIHKPSRVHPTRRVCGHDMKVCGTELLHQRLFLHPTTQRRSSPSSPRYTCPHPRGTGSDHNRPRIPTSQSVAATPPTRGTNGVEH